MGTKPATTAVTEDGLPTSVLGDAGRGDAQAVTAWLDEGGGVDARSAELDGATLLMGAAAVGNEAMVRMLLQRGASVNLQNSLGSTALMGAAINGHSTIVQALLDAKADASLQTESGGTALIFAEEQKQPAAAQVLRQHSKRPTAAAEARAAVAATELLAQVAAEQEAAAKKVAKGTKKKGKAAPTAAAAEPAAAAPLAGAFEPASAEAGLPVAMANAACEGDAQGVVAWLDGGGGVDARCVDGSNMTLLIAVAEGGQEAMVRMLLQRGASINLQDFFGATALICAAYGGHTTIVQALLDAKADASLRTTTGSTALLVAEQEKHIETVQLLRQHAKPQASGRPYDSHPVSGPLSGRRVRISGLKGRPELNEQCGVAGRFDAAKGRYEVAVEGEVEAVLLKSANLQETFEPPPSALTLKR